MLLNIKEYLMDLILENNIEVSQIQLPDAQINTDNIKVIMINEVPPQNPADYFYSKSDMPDYMKTTLELFHNAGMEVRDINDIISRGIYLTTAVKSPKLQYAVSKEIIVNHLPILENEIDMFPNLKVVMLMGDVAKKAFNMIAKKRTKRNAIPSESTYKIRGNEFYYGNLRVFPSYIMTGGNILIEKSKCAMISDDISRMMKIIVS